MVMNTGNCWCWSGLSVGVYGWGSVLLSTFIWWWSTYRVSIGGDLWATSVDIHHQSTTMALLTLAQDWNMMHNVLEISGSLTKVTAVGRDVEPTVTKELKVSNNLIKTISVYYHSLTSLTMHFVNCGYVKLEFLLTTYCNLCCVIEHKLNSSTHQIL